MVPKRQWDEKVRERATAAAARSARPTDAEGISLPPLQREETEHGINYRHVEATFDRAEGLVNITVYGPEGDVPDTVERVHELGADFWPLAMTRELDDLILRLRANELELGTWVIRTRGRHRGRAGLRAGDRRALRLPSRTGWSTRSATTSSAR